MSQVYRFTDENGQVRLFAEIAPDPAGTPFNGGTITAGLEIDPPTTSQALAIVGGVGSGAAASNEITVDDDDGTRVFAVDAAGSTSIGLQSANGGTFRVTVDGGNGMKFSAFRPGLVLFQTSAPVDAALNNSSFTLWLDDTPAATKLMVKAKDSGGTVRTAAIALS